MYSALFECFCNNFFFEKVDRLTVCNQKKKKKNSESYMIHLSASFFDCHK